MQNGMLDQQIGARIEQLRISFGFSREALAEQLGISWQHLSNIEKGRRRITFDLLLNLKEIFQTSMDYLVYGDEESNETSNLLAILSGVDKNLYPYLEEALISFIKGLHADRESRK